MADEIVKILKKVSRSDREKLLIVLKKIRSKECEGLDIKKIKGEDNQFRVRVGGFRILFAKESDDFVIKWVRRRNENTY